MVSLGQQITLLIMLRTLKCRGVIMFKPGFILENDLHLQAAMFNKSKVDVWQYNKIIDYGGSENAVMINSGRFLKETSQFRIR